MAYIDKVTVLAQGSRSKVERRGYPAASWPTIDTWVATKTQTGTKVPNWKELIANEQNASSDYKLEAVRLKKYREANLEIGMAKYSGVKYSNGLSGSLDPVSWPIHIAGNYDDAAALALAKTYKKIREAQQEMNSPSVLAEFVDVLRQFGRPARGVADLLNRHLNKVELAKKGIKGSASFKRVKWHEILSDLYLEWSFGLSPLISDTEDLAIAFARFKYELEFDKNPKFRKRIRSRAGSNTGTHVVRNDFAGHIPCSYIRTIKKETERTVQYVVGMKATHTADFGSNERLLQLLGFDHANWVPGLWEAVPWSWLVDYFFNIQSILEAGVTSTAGVVWVNETRRTKTVENHSYVFDPVATQIATASTEYMTDYNTTDLGEVITERFSMQRLKLDSLPIPPLVTKNPFGNYKKLANLIAVTMAREPSSSKVWFK